MMTAKRLRKFLKVLVLGLGLTLAQPTQGELDQNGNGISDFWEKKVTGGDLLDFIDPAEDEDGDGESYLLESIAGTDPFNGEPPEGFFRADVLHIPATYMTPQGGGDPVILNPEAFTVEWPTLVGKRYSLYCSQDLTAGSWTPVEEGMTCDGSGIRICLLPATQGGSRPEKLFWKVGVWDVDSDGDGLNDHEESLAGCDPSLTDTDSDGLSDKQEVILGTRPDLQDTDGDGLSDSQELTLGTNPKAEDTDDDGTPDGVEVGAGTDAIEDLPAFRPGHCTVNTVRGIVRGVNLPSYGDGEGTIFYNKITYSDQYEANSSSSSTTSSYTQTREWKDETLETGGFLDRIWSVKDTQEGSYHSLVTVTDSQGQFSSSTEETWNLALREVTPLTSPSITGTRVVTSANGNTTTSSPSRSYPILSDGHSIPQTASAGEPDPETPDRRKWTATASGGNSLKTWELSGVQPWRTIAEQSRALAQVHATGSGPQTYDLISKGAFREQGDTVIAHVSGSRRPDGTGIYEKSVVTVTAEDQTVLLRTSSYHYGDNFAYAEDHTIATIPPGQTRTFTLEAVPAEGFDDIAIYLDYSVVEVRSRDRAFVGTFMFSVGADQTLSFKVGTKDYGTYQIETGEDGDTALVYPAERHMFGWAETDNHDAWSSQTGAMSSEELQALEGATPDPALPGANPVGFGSLTGDAAALILGLSARTSSSGERASPCISCPFPTTSENSRSR